MAHLEAWYHGMILSNSATGMELHVAVTIKDSVQEQGLSLR